MTKNWEDMRERICTLYKQDGHTLEDVRKIMMEQDGFKASTRSYRDKLSRWNAYKFNSKRASSQSDPSHFYESGYETDQSARAMKMEHDGDPETSWTPSPTLHYVLPTDFLARTQPYLASDRRPEPSHTSCPCVFCPQKSSAMHRTMSNDSGIVYAEPEKITAAQALLSMTPQSVYRIDSILNPEPAAHFYSRRVATNQSQMSA